MLIIFETIIPVFAVVLIGFGLRKSGFIPADQWKTVEDLSFWVLFPALLLKFIATADFSKVETGPPLFTVLAFTLVMGLLTLALWPVLKSQFDTSKAQYSTIYQTTTRWNGFVGLVIALALYGDASGPLMALILALMTIIIQISNLFMLAAFTPGARPGLANILKMVAKNPIIISIAIGLLLNYMQITMWPPIISTLDLTGRAAMGTSLLAVGAGLSIKALFKPSKELLAGVIGKLFISPLVMLGLALLFGVTGMALSVLVLCASIPTAANGYLFAKKMGGDAPLYAATSTAQTILSFLTIPLMLLMANHFGGL